jgi:DNA-binding MarR family transcriptional regulator
MNTMATQKKRNTIIEELMESGRKMSRASLLFRHAVSDAVGLYVTDAECIDYLLEAGSATAGELASTTGLTTGSVTTMIDRLEKAGYVKRETDKTDKRKVIVKPVLKKIEQFAPFYDALVKEARELYSSYTIHELEILKEHNDKLTALYENQIKKIQV